MTFEATLANLYAKRASVVPDSPDEPEPEKPVIDFTFGHPDPNFFPVEHIRSAIARVLQTSASIALQYSDFRGSKVLLEVLVSHLSQKLGGMQLNTRNLIVTNGSMQALGLVAQVFIEPGDLVFVEEPTYFRAASVFRNNEANVRGIPVDQDGLRIDLLESALQAQARSGRGPKILYTMPTHQNPSGMSLSLERRRQLLDLSSQYGFVILEDTAYNDLWYDKAPPPSLFEIDAGFGRVIQMGTFSKVMAPGLSVGWALGAEPAITRFVEFKVNGGTTPLTSLTVAAFLADVHFSRHVDSLRYIYKAKRDAMIEALEEHMRDYATWHRPGGGYFLWLQLREDVLLDALWLNALSEGVLYLPGKFCFANEQRAFSQVRLSFSALSPEDIKAGVRRLSIAVKHSCKE